MARNLRSADRVIGSTSIGDPAIVRSTIHVRSDMDRRSPDSPIARSTLTRSPDHQIADSTN
jgi:hypothetical protein